MTINRRQFVQTTLGAAAALGAVHASRAAQAANADIRIATIGFNGRGNDHIQGLGKHIVALCDCDQHVLQNKLDQLKKSGRTVDGFTDYRKLLERKDIDAVSIATPNHTHSLIAIAAIQAGKHVYCEKPVSHNIWEGRQLVAAARRHDRIVQTGTQSRSSKALQDAAAYLRSGELGPIRYALATCYKPRPSIGKSDKPFQFPSYIDRDLWIGPAADEVFYRPEISTTGKPNPHYDWHWDFNTGAGDIGNQGIHQMDIARWMLGEKALAPRVISFGGRVGYDDAGNTPNTLVAYHAYENAPLIFEVRGLPRAKSFQQDYPRWEAGMDNYRGIGIGNLVQCEKGYVVIGNSYFDAVVYDNTGKELKKFTGGPEHYQNWLAAIDAGDRGKLNAEIEEGHLSSALCHAANVSYRVGKTASSGEIAEQIAGSDLLSASFDRMVGHLRSNGVDVDGEPILTLGEWLDVDPATETFVGNDAASALRGREVQRKPFEVPDVERETSGQAASTGG